MKLDSCIQEQGTALSRTELLTAYTVLSDLGTEQVMLLGGVIAGMEKTNTAKDTVLKTAGDIIANESKQYDALVARYNGLVDLYNELLTSYKSYAADEYSFLARIEAYVSSINSSYNWSPPSPPQVIQAAPTRTQIHCTTQTTPPAAPGLSSWSYTNCN